MKCLILATCLLFAQVVFYPKSAAKTVQPETKQVTGAPEQRATAHAEAVQGPLNATPGSIVASASESVASNGAANAPQQVIQNAEPAGNNAQPASGNGASANGNGNSTGQENKNAATGNQNFMSNLKLTNSKMIEKAKAFIGLILKKVHHYATKLFSLFDLFSKKYLDSGLAKIQKLSEESTSTGDFFNKCAIELYNAGLRIIEKFEKIALPTFDRLITEVSKIGESKTLNEFVVKAGMAVADVVA